MTTKQAYEMIDKFTANLGASGIQKKDIALTVNSEVMKAVSPVNIQGDGTFELGGCRAKFDPDQEMRWNIEVLNPDGWDEWVSRLQR